MTKSKRRASSDDESSDDECFLPIEASSPELIENMDALMKHLKETLMSNDKKGKIRLGPKKNPILVSLGKYQRVLNKTSPIEHKEYFMKVYRKYRTLILANDDRWLRSNVVRIVYSTTNYKILLSAIYNIACNLEEAAEKRLSGLGDIAYEGEIDVIRKDIILLHLYRVFREFAPEQDHKRLTEIIEDFEDLLGDETSKSKTSSSPTSVLGGMDLGAIGDLAGSLVKEISQTAEENKMSPDDIPNLGKMVETMMKNDNIKGIFSALMSNLGTSPSDTQSFESVIDNVQTVLKNPQTSEALSGVMSCIKESVDDRTFAPRLSSEGPHGLAIDTVPRTSEVLSAPDQLVSLDLPLPSDPHQ